jgi:hypothetical protein
VRSRKVIHTSSSRPSSWPPWSRRGRQALPPGRGARLREAMRQARQPPREALRLPYALQATCRITVQQVGATAIVMGKARWADAPAIEHDSASYFLGHDGEADWVGARRNTRCEKLALRQGCEEADRRLRKRTKGLPRKITGLLVDMSPLPRAGVFVSSASISFHFLLIDRRRNMTPA